MCRISLPHLDFAGFHQQSHENISFCVSFWACFYKTAGVPHTRLLFVFSQTGLRNWESAGERAGAAAPSKSSTGRASSNIDSLLWTTVVDCQLLNLDTHTHTYTYTNDCAHTKRQKNIQRFAHNCAHTLQWDATSIFPYQEISGISGKGVQKDLGFLWA